MRSRRGASCVVRCAGSIAPWPMPACCGKAQGDRLRRAGDETQVGAARRQRRGQRDADGVSGVVRGQARPAAARCGQRLAVDRRGLRAQGDLGRDRAWSDRAALLDGVRPGGLPGVAQVESRRAGAAPNDAGRAEKPQRGRLQRRPGRGTPRPAPPATAARTADTRGRTSALSHRCQKPPTRDRRDPECREIHQPRRRARRPAKQRSGDARKQVDGREAARRARGPTRSGRTAESHADDGKRQDVDEVLQLAPHPFADKPARVQAMTSDVQEEGGRGRNAQPRHADRATAHRQRHEARRTSWSTTVSRRDGSG